MCGWIIQTRKEKLSELKGKTLHSESEERRNEASHVFLPEQMG